MQERIRKVACENCRIKKKKCDGAFPVCSTCKAVKSKSKTKSDCHYQKSTKYYQIVEAKLLDRIEYLETQLNQVGIPVNQDLDLNSNSSTAMETSLQLHQSENQTASNLLLSFSKEVLFTKYYLPQSAVLYSPYNFGNIFEDLDHNEFENGLSVVEISQSIRRSLMDCFKLFASGSFDDSYKLFFFNYAKGKKYSLLNEKAVFNFPTGFPTNLPIISIPVIQLNEDENLELQILWSVFLKVDNLLNTSTDESFIIQEASISIDGMIKNNTVYPEGFQRNMALLSNLDSSLKQIFTDHIKMIRQVRNCVNFYKMDLSRVSIDDIKVRVNAMHAKTLLFFKKVPEKGRIFDTFESFEVAYSFQPLESVNLTRMNIFPFMIYTMLCAMIHSKALQMGCTSRYPLTNSNRFATFESHEILLFHIRAYKYLITQYLYHTKSAVQDEPLDAYQIANYICTSFEISKTILAGLAVLPSYRVYLREAFMTIKTEIYPCVMEIGWKWGVGSFYASKLQVLLRLYANVI
ncbi:hypothetical protein BC833DRAFT_605348 [Globomyces pollinis-pini]|nr:hypothetical protein BC833DRAFT_605348 [Globomyces pollinis-pini]